MHESNSRIYPIAHPSRICNQWNLSTTIVGCCCYRVQGKKRKSRATVTFAPSGRATSVQISGGAAGTSAGSCAANIFRGASIPPFTGSAQTVAKTFYVKL